MSVIPDVVRNFQFAVEFDGIDQFLIQKVSGLEKEFETLTYGDIGADVERPGRPKAQDVTFEKILKADGADNYAWDVLQKIYNNSTGKYAAPTDYLRNWVLKMLNPNGSVAKRLILTEGWVKKVAMSDFDRLGNDKVIETITLSVRDIVGVKA